MGFWNWLKKVPTIPPPPHRTTREIMGSFREIDPVCLNCRYNLRGLPGPGKCPECGAEASESWLVYLSNRTGYSARAFYIFACALRWYRGTKEGKISHVTARDFCYIIRA